MPALPEDLEEIADRRPGRAGDDGDRPRKPRERPFALGGKQPFRREPFVQPAELQFQGPHSLESDLADIELVAAARGIDVEPALADHFHPIVQLDRQPRGGSAPQNSADLRMLILERKVAVPRLRPREVRYLAADPQRGKRVFQQPLDQRRQLGHRQYALTIVWSGGRLGR